MSSYLINPNDPKRSYDAFIGDRAHGLGLQAPALDLSRGGQMGFAPELSEWVSNAAYKRYNLIPILVEEPRGFQYLPNPEYWTRTLKALVERHPLTIDGLNAGLEVATSENPVGGAGQVQHEFVNVTEVPSNPAFSWMDKAGMPISNFWRRYITYLLMDPNSKVAGISTLPGNQNIPAMLPDMYTFTMLFIEPDAHHTHVMKAWLVSNMFPRGTGDIVGRREITADLEGQAVDIEFGGIAQYGPGVMEFAQRILNTMNVTYATPGSREAFVQKLSANVVAAGHGIRENIVTTARGNVERPAGTTVPDVTSDGSRP